MNWDAWLLGARAGRAFVLAISLAIAWVVWETSKQGFPVSKTPVEAVVTEVFEKAYAVKLDNGRQARIYRQGDYKVGDRITVILTSYDNGEQTVTLPADQLSDHSRNKL